MSAILLLIAALAVVNIETTETCNRKMDFVLSVDVSSTICGGTESCPKWKAILQFCKDIVNSLTIGLNDTRVAFVTFSYKTKVEWDLRAYTDKTSLMSAIDNVKYPGGELIDIWSIANIITEIFNPLGRGDRFGVQNVGILITDGAPNYSDWVYGLISGVIQWLRGVAVFVVCATPGCTEQCARGIASSPQKANETYFLINNYLSIDQVRDTVVKKLCTYKFQLLLNLSRK